MAFAPKRQPVYGVSKFRGGGCFFRRIWTTDEIKINQHIDDDEPRARASRCIGQMPTCFDDPPKCVQRSWKVHRRNQWKG